MNALLLCLSQFGFTCAAAGEVMRWDFEEAAVGKLPAGWTSTKTGKGRGSVWKIVEDRTAPKGKKVLAQTAVGPSSLFNLCVADKSHFQDGEISVALKAVEGDIDQGGGLGWRYQDANNYYVARINPLESNYRLYKVVDGKRKQLATMEEVKAPAGTWHTLTVKHRGEQIECYLNGKKCLSARDDAITKPGKMGLWTKADAQSSFAALSVIVAKK